jgi:long-chain acyl-CoA synthetase
MIVTAPTVSQLWCARVAASPAELAFEHRVDGTWRMLTWRQADERVRRIAAGLIALGVDPGERVAILAGTSLEWVLADFGVLCAGAAVTTIYPSNTPDECAYILEDSGAVAVFADDVAQVAKLVEVAERVATVRHVVVFDPEGVPAGAPGETCSLDELEERGADWLEAHPDGFDERVEAVSPGDLATVIYTSGTTGPPKGVMLAHDAWAYQAEAITASLGQELQPGDKQYLFLPLAHSFGKVCELIAVAVGAPTAIEGDLDHLLQGIQHTRPTLMAAVPRVFEKIHQRIVNRARDAGERRFAIFEWAVAQGDAAAALRLAGEPVPLGLRLRDGLARRLVFRRLQDALGGRIRAFVSGGAPLSPEIARFFYAADMRILEGYGMTETSAGAVANRFDELRFGTVGKPLDGCEVRIAADGEILMRGRNLMLGYFNRPEATAEAIDADGWLHSGDLGSLDEDGWLRITGRKKDLIITAGGKNIPPQNVEHQVKTSSYIAEVVMHGDRRPYCVALVVLDEEAVGAWAVREGLPGPHDLAHLSAAPEVRELIWSEVARVNATLPSYETIKRIALLDRELTVEAGDLTPSMKVKRRVVEAQHRELLDSLYE